MTPVQGEETVMQKIHSAAGTICGVSAFTLSAAFFLAPASAQERCKVDEMVSAQNTKYTEQHVMDVGDVPGHQIRIFELRRAYPDDKANCEGLKRTESLSHAATDYLNANGTLHGYSVTTYDNGDKMFSVVDGIAQNVVNADGSKKGTYTGVDRVTGGTGKYLNARGLIRETINFDLAKGFNESHSEGEYWIEK
jgi:hypothetical protein